MKKITIEITEELTPMHREIFLKILYCSLRGIQDFWHARSKKHFNISVDDVSISNLDWIK